MIDVSKQVMDMKNNPIMDEDKKPVTLDDLIVNALLASLPEDSSLSGKEKIKYFTLANKIHGKTEVSLESEDVTLIKNRVAKVYGPLVVGRIWQTIDPSSVE